MARYTNKKKLGAGLAAVFTGWGLFTLIFSLVLLPVNQTLAATSGDYAAMPLASQAGGAKPNILIILDNSNSMDEDVDGNAVGSQDPTSRSEIARTAIKSVIEQNGDFMRFGLMTYKQGANNVNSTWYSTTYYDVSYRNTYDSLRPLQTPVSANPADGNLHYAQAMVGGGYNTQYNDALYCYYFNGQSTSCGASCTSYPYYCCSQKTATDQSNANKTPANIPNTGVPNPTLQGYGYSGTCNVSSWIGIEGTSNGTYPNAQMAPWGQEMAFTTPVRAWVSSSTPGQGILHVNIADTTSSVNIGGITYTQRDLLNAKLATESFVTDTGIQLPGSNDVANRSNVYYVGDGGPTMPIRNAGDTPMPGTLQSALQYFQNNLPAANVVTGVNANNPISSSCQQNYVIYLTDGEPTTLSNGSNLTTSADLLQASITQIKALRQVNNPNVTGQTVDVKTFVIGFGSDVAGSSNLLDQLAAAGGGTDDGKALIAGNKDALNSALQKIFQQIGKNMTSGTAAAINTNSRSGEGGVFPAMFYPQMQDDATPSNTIYWAGDVAALFIDQYGRLREDSNGNGVLDNDGSNPDQVVTYQQGGGGIIGFATPVGAMTEQTKLDLSTTTAAALAGTYFYINASDNRHFYVCFNVDGTVVADTAVNGTGKPYRKRLEEVKLTAGDTAASIALKIASVLSSTLIFQTEVSGNTLTVTNIVPGPVDNASAETSNISITTTQQGGNPSPGNPDTVGTQSDIKYIWSASDWLAGVGDVTTQRDDYTSTDNKRYIITFIDGNQDGIPASGEQVDFVAPDPASINLTNPDLSALYPYIPVSEDSGLDGGQLMYRNTSGVITPVPAANAQDYIKTQAGRVINFIRGQDQPAAAVGGLQLSAFRSRQINYKGAQRTWRLGDVIHSSPLVIDRPNLAYSQVYDDNSYAKFMTQYANRRTVLYVGGNDGMLHAFNGGFYENRFAAGGNPNGPVVMQYLKQPLKWYEDVTGTSRSLGPDTSFKAYDLGAELWAYVPYNLLAHLYWLTEPAVNSNLNHVYYVDLKPVSYDVQMFTADDDHPGGWGTILVGGMGFGGGAINDCVKRDTAAGTCTTSRPMSSAYFIFDITNPEKKPKLLTEFALPHMGYTLNSPTLAYFKDSNVTPPVNTAYLVFGSGPASSTGVTDSDSRRNVRSGQQGRLFYVKLPSPGQSLASVSSWGLPNGGNLSTCRTAQATPPATTPVAPECSMQTIGGDPSYVSEMVGIDTDLDYKTDVLYYGTVVSKTNDTLHQHLYGKLGRIVTNSKDNASQWDTDSTLIDLSAAELGLYQPITSAPNAAFDSNGNLYVYFGTGRYLTADDQANNDQQAFYGIKEPRDGSGNFTWTPVTYASLYNSTNVKVQADVGGVQVTGGSGGTGGSWRNFLSYMGSNSVTGWVYKLRLPAQLAADGITGSAERAINQPVITNSLFYGSSFVPTTDNPCSSQGQSYIYSLYYTTGTAALSINGTPITYRSEAFDGELTGLRADGKGGVNASDTNGNPTINYDATDGGSSPDNPPNGGNGIGRLNWQEISN